jgi:hypothetical protein
MGVGVVGEGFWWVGSGEFLNINSKTKWQKWVQKELRKSQYWSERKARMKAKK